jgi:hypothetical protein
MRSKDHSNKPPKSKPSNAFSRAFLRRLGERDEPPTAGAADVAGPWRIVPIPGHGFGLFREGESLARGFMPAAVFPERFLALLAAAVLPGTGRDPMLHLSNKEDADGFYPVTLDDSQTVGQFQLFNEPLLDAINHAVHVLGSPVALACLIEAAGAICLERTGAILDERVPEVDGDTPE